MSLETESQYNGVNENNDLAGPGNNINEVTNPASLENGNNIDDEYAAFMNSDNELLAGENDSNLVNLDVNESEIHKVILSQGDEWIVELRSDQSLFITINTGICEIFGIEMATGVEYTFRNQERMVLFAVEACDIEYRTNKTFIKDFPECILQNDPNVVAIYALALKFAQKRLGNLKGPRILVIGDSKVGKTSLAKTLLSYAVKMINSSNCPVFVNLDPTKGIFTLPGPISATIVDDSLDAESPIWGESTTSSTHPLVPAFQPIVKQIGFEEINRYNYDFYVSQVESLAEEAAEMINKSFHSNRCGMIVDTPYFSIDENVIIPNTEPERINTEDIDMEEEEEEDDIDENENEQAVEQHMEIQVPEQKLLPLKTPTIEEAPANKSSDYESEYEDELKVPELAAADNTDYVTAENVQAINHQQNYADDEDDDYKLSTLKPATQMIDLPYDHEFIGKLVEKFDIDHIIDVVNTDGHSDVNKFLNDRLFSLSSRVSKAFILPVIKSSSINPEKITDSFKRFMQRTAIRAYFYGGSSKFPLSPYTTTVRYEDVHIFKHSDDDCKSLVKIGHITKDLLQYSILAVTNADIKTRDSDAIISSGIMGYVLVLSVMDAANKQMLKILSPTMGDLPRKAMILSEYKYYE